MNVQKLNIILEALKYGSMTKAAEKLGYTQSALTYAINSTEQELGFPVVIRDANGIRLSKEGEELFPCIQDMVECESRLMAKANEIKRRRGNVLNIAVYPSTADVLLPEILADFNKEAPDVTVNVTVGSYDDIIGWLMKHSIDFGIGGQMKLPGFEWIPLIEDPEMAILPLDFPTDGMTVFPMEDFKKHPFVEPVFWADETAMAKQIEKYGIVPLFNVTSPYNAPVIAMVEQGIALSTITKFTIQPHSKVKALPIDPPCSRILGASYHKKNCQDKLAAAKFLKCIKRWKKKREEAEE